MLVHTVMRITLVIFTIWWPFRLKHLAVHIAGWQSRTCHLRLVCSRTRRRLQQKVTWEWLKQLSLGICSRSWLALLEEALKLILSHRLLLLVEFVDKDRVLLALRDICRTRLLIFCIALKIPILKVCCLIIALRLVSIKSYIYGQCWL